MPKKLYLIDWDSSDMIGGFDGNTLNQCFNTDKKLLSWSIQHYLEMEHIKSCEIEFLESHEELNNLRRSRNLETKPTYDVWLQNQFKDLKFS